MRKMSKLGLLLLAILTYMLVEERITSPMIKASENRTSINV